MRSKPSTGQEGLIGEVGVARTRLDPEGQVFVHGELWKARCDGEAGAGEGLEIAREIAGEILAHFKGIYFITPFLRYELTAELGAWVRKQEKARKRA